MIESKLLKFPNRGIYDIIDANLEINFYFLNVFKAVISEAKRCFLLICSKENEELRAIKDAPLSSSSQGLLLC